MFAIFYGAAPNLLSKIYCSITLHQEFFHCDRKLIKIHQDRNVEEQQWEDICTRQHFRLVLRWLKHC